MENHFYYIKSPPLNVAILLRTCVTSVIIQTCKELSVSKMFIYCISEERVWKLAYRFPNFLPESHLSTESLHCRRARHLDPPYLFDMTSDPGEMRPIDINSNSEYKKIVNIVDEATQKHIKSIQEVKSRLKMVDISWYPHLQPCCNFPLCSCTEEKYKDVR